MPVRARFLAFARTATKRLLRVFREESANVAIMFGLSAPVLLGGAGIALEAGNWYYTRREMQNAADAAAIAASSNGTSSYATEAQAVTANYGFVNGSNSVTVTPLNNQPCPDGTTTCYTVTITKSVPLYLAQVLGYNGNTTVGGHKGVSLQTSATATQGSQQVQLCLLALGTTSTDIISNGAPNANLAGCNIMADSSSTCNGHNLGANYGIAHGSDNGCGINQVSNAPIVPDPYAYLASQIPAMGNHCGTTPTYPQEDKHGGGLPSSNMWSSSTLNLANSTVMCGDQQLQNDVTINDTNGPAVLVIENGQLDLNGHTLSTASGSSVTLIFSGDGTSGYTHYPTGGGTLATSAPTSGTWKGMALYQDPSITDGVSFTYAGNTPEWDMNGIVYLPNANVTFSGAVNKNATSACFMLVVNDLTINGTGDIISQNLANCNNYGFNLPNGTVPGRGRLVL